MDLFTKDDIEYIHEHNFEELCEKLHGVTIRDKPDIKIYDNVCIEKIIQKYPHTTGFIIPAQRYVLMDELLKVKHLYHALNEFKSSEIDIFNLEGYVSIKFKDLDYKIDVLPPIVEKTKMPDGKWLSVLNDGMHRLYLAQLEHRAISVIEIYPNYQEDFPYYAFPLTTDRNGFCTPDTWNEIKLFPGSEPPEGYLKRWPRIPNHKTLYRDFNSVFGHVSGRHVIKKD